LIGTWRQYHNLWIIEPPLSVQCKYFFKLLCLGKMGAPPGPVEPETEKDGSRTEQQADQ
jgi:hypothetical protein